MGITYSNKELSTDSISCSGSFRIRLSLTAEPDITENPVDIVLILDRSGSMRGSPLQSLKAAANTFIDIIDEATDSAMDGNIGGGSRIGIVSFATSAEQNTQLITDVSQLKSAVSSLTAAGNTNHREAFEEALALFDFTSSNEKIMVMFTDGKTSAGGPPAPVAESAKAQGVTIYVIGLEGSDSLDIDAINSWASDPDSAYVAIAPDESKLEELFEDLARNITKPGATNIVIRDVVSDCFRITSVSAPTVGTATLSDQNTVEWNIASLGVNGSEGAVLEFDAEHLGACSGDLIVNESISYSDAENNSVSFPSPVINVDCGIVIVPEECPEPVRIDVSGCEDTVIFDAGSIELNSQGRILQLDVTLNSVCPGKRVALAVIITEIDSEGNEHRRGMKTLTIPAHTSAQCRDVEVRCIKFVLPDDSGTVLPPCAERRYNARFVANYTDDGFDCCPLLQS